MFCLSLMYKRKAKHCPVSKTWLSLLTLPQASSCDHNQSYNFQSTDWQCMKKSGFFRQHLITSIRRRILKIRKAHQDLVYDLSACFIDSLSVALGSKLRLFPPNFCLLFWCPFLIVAYSLVKKKLDFIQQNLSCSFWKPIPKHLVTMYLNRR